MSQKRVPEACRKTTGPVISPSGTFLVLGVGPIVSGIVYHLIDEGLADRIDLESVRATLDRLERKRVRLKVRRGVWAVMSNRRRLDWLLSGTGTVIVSDPTGVASLRTADALP